jgi:hypothetical protein
MGPRRGLEGSSYEGSTEAMGSSPPTSKWNSPHTLQESDKGSCAPDPALCSKCSIKASLGSEEG